MSNFIREIISFFWNILLNIRDSIQNLVSNNDAFFYRISASVANWDTFLDKNIFNGELLNIGLTYRELLLYLIPIIFIFLFVYLIIKLILKLLNFVRID